VRRYTGQAATAWAMGLIVAGFVTIAMGWRGAAATLFVPTQVAFAVSGGIAGLTMIGAGCAILTTQLDRLLAADASHDLDGVLERTAAAVAELTAPRSGP